MELTNDICRTARLSRDVRFDGKFFTGVHTTGIFCRPVCPATPPKEKNVRYYKSAAQASEAGLRPCLRCRPETAASSPIWNGTSTTVDRGMALIGSGFLNTHSVTELSEYLGVGERHLRRLFIEHIGSAPKKIAQMERLFFAKKLLVETALPITEIAFASGFNSLRRFNDAFKQMFERSPTDVRKTQPNQATTQIYLPYRTPYRFTEMLLFFKDRAIKNVEDITEARYRRTISIEGTVGTIQVEDDPAQSRLILSVNINQTTHLMMIVQKVKQLFDLNSDITTIFSHLKRDEILASKIDKTLHLPGAWDCFEFSIRAILGQQISVKAATTFASRIAQTYGKYIGTGSGLNLVFPCATDLKHARFETIGLTRTRQETLIHFIKAVNEKSICLELNKDLESVVNQLKTIKGIGDWTAHYIAMRGLSDPDAFPSTDLGVLKAMKIKGKEIQRVAEHWRPWRSYATLVLWNSLKGD